MKWGILLLLLLLHTDGTYLVEVLTGGSHLLPGFVEQLDADAEEFLEGAIVGEEHGVEVVAVLAGCGRQRDGDAVRTVK